MVVPLLYSSTIVMLFPSHFDLDTIAIILLAMIVSFPLEAAFIGCSVLSLGLGLDGIKKQTPRWKNRIIFVSIVSGLMVIFNFIIFALSIWRIIVS